MAPYVAWGKNHGLVKQARDGWSGLRGSNPPPRPWQGRALPNELNPHRSGSILSRRWCLRSESNQRHEDFQSPALPTELQRQTRKVMNRSFRNGLSKMATRRGLEPLTSSVTGSRSNQLNYRAVYGADYGARTRHLRLGKATLYQMS